MVINREVLIRLNGFYKDIVLLFTGLYITGKKNRINRFFNCFYRLSTGKEPAGFPENNPVSPEVIRKTATKKKREKKIYRRKTGLYKRKPKTTRRKRRLLFSSKVWLNNECRCKHIQNEKNIQLHYDKLFPANRFFHRSGYRLFSFQVGSGSLHSKIV